MPGSRPSEEAGYMMHSGPPPRAMRLASLLGLLLALAMAGALAGCAYWTHPTKPSAAFTADASACQAESFQASTTYDSFDVTRHNAYLACLRSKGWALQERP